MKVSKIKKIGNTSRYNIYLDDKWAGIFSDEILVAENIKTGDEIDESRFKTIKFENDKRVSFDLAVGYIEKYVVSEKGIKDYLKKKGFEPKIVALTVEKLREYGFVDDEKFAKNYFDSISSTKGKRVIAQKLRQKGVKAEIVETLLENVDEDDEIQKATVLAEKFAKNRQNDPKLWQKCLAHLLYKGYDYSVAAKATSKVVKKGEENDWF